MNPPDPVLEIRTLGSFSVSAAGKPVATDWPDENLKVLFCSLLSPLDLFFSWDRLCRSIWSGSATRASRRRLEEMYVQPLVGFLIKELGFNPLISEQEGIRIDRQRIHVDVFEFHSTAIEGLSLLSLGNHDKAREKFSRAGSLYAGDYLPGMPGKIIAGTRAELESLYWSAVMDAMPRTLNSGCPGRTGRAEPELHVTASRRPVRALNCGHE